MRIPGSIDSTALHLTRFGTNIYILQLTRRTRHGTATPVMQQWHARKSTARPSNAAYADESTRRLSPRAPQSETLERQQLIPVAGSIGMSCRLWLSCAPAQGGHIVPHRGWRLRTCLFVKCSVRFVECSVRFLGHIGFYGIAVTGKSLVPGYADVSMPLCSWTLLVLSRI